MIATPQNLEERLQQRYHSIQRKWLENTLEFPMIFSIGQLPNNIPAARQIVQQWQAHSIRYGYYVEFVDKKTRTMGNQSMPIRLSLPTLECVLTICNKQTDFGNFSFDVEIIREELPDLETWLPLHVNQIGKYHGKWDKLCHVCQYFAENDVSDRFSRELPLRVDTKFVEQHKGIIEQITSVVRQTRLDLDKVNRTKLLTRLDESFFRVRILDNKLNTKYGIPFSDFALPMNELKAMDWSECIVLLVENKVSFLTLPTLQNTIAFFTSGFDVSELSHIFWLSQTNILYWGDVDAHGFEILSLARSFFPKIVSVMMDRETLHQFSEFTVISTLTTTKTLANLAPDEMNLYRFLSENNLRLEQEKFDREYIRANLTHAIETSL